MKALAPKGDTCTCSIGDAAELPYDDGQFYPVISTRFQRDIAAFSKAKKKLAEMVRVSLSLLNIQSGSAPVGNTIPLDHELRGSTMSTNKLYSFLSGCGLVVRDEAVGTVQLQSWSHPSHSSRKAG